MGDLGDLSGKKVIVFSNAGTQERQDIGQYEGTDGTWLRLRKGDEVLYLCLYNVRLLKPFDPL